MTKGSPSILIGDLLVRAGLVTREQLAGSIPLSSQTGLPVGRVLIGNGFLAEDKLHAALRAQSLIRDNVLPIDIAIAGLQKMNAEQLLFDDALFELGWRSEYFDLTNKLGQLLRDAGIVTSEVVNACLHTCFTTGLPLGRVLVLQGVITDATANAALLSQILIRDGKIDREQGVAALRSAAQYKTSIEESLDFHGFLRRKSSQTVRLGELLVLAGLVSEIDLLSCVENALITDTPVGQNLVKSKLISQRILDAALHIQKMVTSGELAPGQAADALKEIEKGISPEDAIAGVTQKRPGGPSSQLLSLAELIRLVGIVPLEDMETSARTALANNGSIVDVLIQRQLVAPTTLSAVMRTHDLLQEHKLSSEQAIFVLHSWLWSRGDIDELLKNLGWIS